MHTVYSLHILTVFLLPVSVPCAPPSWRTIMPLLNTRHCYKAVKYGLYSSYVVNTLWKYDFAYVGVTIVQKQLTVEQLLWQHCTVWHSEDRASWYILIIKPRDALISHIYFWNRTLHVLGQVFCPKHVEFCSKNKFEKLVHLVGFIRRKLYCLLEKLDNLWLKSSYVLNMSIQLIQLKGVY